jgi:hypothetical protein
MRHAELQSGHRPKTVTVILGGAGVVARPIIQAAQDDIAAAAAAHQELGRDHDGAITVTSMNGGQ